MVDERQEKISALQKEVKQIGKWLLAVMDIDVNQMIKLCQISLEEKYTQ